MNKASQDPLERVRRFLLGIADLFELLAPKLREFARELGDAIKRPKKGD